MKIIILVLNLILVISCINTKENKNNSEISNKMEKYTYIQTSIEGLYKAEESSAKKFEQKLKNVNIISLPQKINRNPDTINIDTLNRFGLNNIYTINTSQINKIGYDDYHILSNKDEMNKLYFSSHLPNMSNLNIALFFTKSDVASTTYTEWILCLIKSGEIVDAISIASTNLTEGDCIIYSTATINTDNKISIDLFNKDLNLKIGEYTVTINDEGYFEY